jgi:hypothetical protein
MGLEVYMWVVVWVRLSRSSASTDVIYITTKLVLH